MADAEPKRGRSNRPQGGGKAATVTPYRKVKRVGHPLAHADGAVYVHRLVRYDKIGSGSHACHWCGDRVTWKRTLVVDHIDGNRWNNTRRNLVPSCDSCNHARPYRSRVTCTHGHPLVGDNVYRRPDGKGKRRQCVICIRRRWKRWWQQNRKCR